MQALLSLAYFWLDLGTLIQIAHWKYAITNFIHYNYEHANETCTKGGPFYSVLELPSHYLLLVEVPNKLDRKSG